MEQQLKDRSIPYTLQYPRKSGAGAPVSASAVAGMVPILCVNARDLLKDGRAADVAMPKVFMQIRDWWKGGKCQVSGARHEIRTCKRTPVGTRADSSHRLSLYLGNG